MGISVDPPVIEEWAGGPHEAVADAAPGLGSREPEPGLSGAESRQAEAPG